VFGGWIFFFFPLFFFAQQDRLSQHLETEGFRQKALLVGSRGQFPVAGLAPTMLQTNFSKICLFSGQLMG